MPPKCILASRPRNQGRVIGPTGCKVQPEKEKDERAIRIKFVNPILPSGRMEIRMNNLQIHKGNQKIDVIGHYDSGWSPELVGISKSFYREHFAARDAAGQPIMYPFSVEGSAKKALFVTSLSFTYKGSEYTIPSVPFMGIWDNTSWNIIFGPRTVEALENLLGRRLKFKNVNK